jgi:anti-anti-sigma factor
VTDRNELDLTTDATARVRVDGLQPTGSPAASSPGKTTVGGPADSPITLVSLRGEVDVVTEPEVSALLEPLCRKPGTDLVVDLRAVTFLDCRGVSPLCRARSRLLAGNGRLRLIVGSPGVDRLLRLTRLDRAFEIVRA